ncbi:head GIN domain-containing protein [Rufibacter latericius]|nr:head GIN domain-containing protein [Rufibacter latericius]
MLFRVRFLFFLFCTFGWFSSCDILGDGPCITGSGPSKSERRDVAAFKGVDMRIGGNVYVTAGPRVEVKVESFSNVLPEISTKVEGGTLVISSGSCIEYADDETNVYISMPELEYASLKGSGIIRIQTVPSPKPLQLNLEGSGAIRYIGSADHIKVRNSGSGDIDLEGFVLNLETNQSGSGRVLGYFLHSDTAKVISSGSGYQQIWVDKVFDATVSGSGNVYYRGFPNLVSTLLTGSGRVINDN